MMCPRPHPGHADPPRVLCLAALLVMAMLLPVMLVGCEQPKDTSADVPTTGDGVFRTREKPDGPRPLVVAIHHLEMLIDQPAEEAWELVNEQAFPPLTRTVWHANGLRPGIIAGADLMRFVDRLPGIVAVQRSTLAPGQHANALITAPRLDETIIVDLTIPPRAVREVPIRSGRLQMLARFWPIAEDGSTAAGIRVELTPHQHVPQISLTPREPLEQQLDGRMFTELTLRADVPMDQMLVIGLFRPALPEEQEPEPIDEPGPGPIPAAAPHQHGPGPVHVAASEPADDPTADPPARPRHADLPPNLGKALLTGRRANMNRHVHVLLLISPEPAPEP